MCRWPLTAVLPLDDPFYGALDPSPAFQSCPFLQAWEILRFPRKCPLVVLVVGAPSLSESIQGLGPVVLLGFLSACRFVSEAEGFTGVLDLELLGGPHHGVIAEGVDKLLKDTYKWDSVAKKEFVIPVIMPEEPLAKLIMKDARQEDRKESTKRTRKPSQNIAWIPKGRNRACGAAKQCHQGWEEIMTA